MAKVGHCVPQLLYAAVENVVRSGAQPLSRRFFSCLKSEVAGISGGGGGCVKS